MSLSKTLFLLLSTGSTQEKNVDWDVKNQHKQMQLWIAYFWSYGTLKLKIADLPFDHSLSVI